MTDLSRGISLEGISCAGKTSTMYEIKKLFACDENLERNIVMLGEHYTQVLNSVNGSFVNHSHSEHVEMLAERITMLEGLHNWGCRLGSYSRRSRGLYTVLERGLINHLAHFEDYDDPVMIDIAARFKALGIEAIVLIISDAHLAERSKLRCGQLNLSKPEEYHLEVAEQAKLRQEALLTAASRSGLDYRVICTDSMEWAKYAQKIVY